MRLSVLLVDNDPLFRWSIVETLSGLGHAVTQASDVDAAIQAITPASTLAIKVGYDRAAQRFTFSEPSGNFPLSIRGGTTGARAWESRRSW